MKSNKILWLVSLLMMLSLVLAACAGDGSGEPEEESDNNEETGSEDTGSEEESENEGDSGSASGGDLVIAIPSDVVSMSTHGSNDVPSSNVQENIYETLTDLDENQEVVPGLAEEWEEVDETTWDFHLREGVKFHDGAELTAEVVKQNFDRLVDEEIASPRAFLFEAVESVEVVDDYTVRINLKYPYAPLLANLAHSGTAIMSPNIIEEDYAQMEEGGDVDAYINQNPVGTGPFVYESWEPGGQVVLSRNENYWGEPAKLDTVTFKVVSEQSTRIAELETDASHVADAIGPNNVSRVENTEGMSVLSSPSVSLSYVSFNVEKEPFDDPKVRQAISMAVNKEEIIQGIYNGAGIPAIGPLAPPVFGYDESVSGLEYDPERAKELLAEAGYEDGFSTTIWTNDNEQRVDTAVAIQNQLSEIGIDVEIEELEWGAYLERTANGEHDMFILGWSTVTSDADYGMYPLFHSSQHGSPGNRSFLSNDEIDSILDEARRETDPEARKELYSQAQEMLVEIAPMIYIHHQEYLLGVDETVQDFGIDAQGIYQIKDAYIE
ncbi:glutathione ABC transporter substrate-binding protein [Tenuibacillus multivorans]|uniref:Peptide/nickel transport system substrate-binding protein n=1 Tax=Tenuibacillus multivorans TaxID=237069 RepID=A0A1G9WU69_9BACI|nr:glutathione ABC transporter substrate-binding protein [Tenuibacillus multivorans]GEL78433.1 glutathione ABC transporter substrate-binding protein [Tenuibacillus multivorans]SDM87716.1 peptide/nickel transport system substrate-binding protein [Tenuibacillus multivorans]